MLTDLKAYAGAPNLNDKSIARNLYLEVKQIIDLKHLDADIVKE